MSTDQALTTTIEIPMAWGEQDAFGHLNNVVYFRYFENVRMYFLERIGVLRSHVGTGIGVILASTTCDFLRPVEWPNKLTVRTGCTAIGTTSFTMTYAIIDERGSLVAKGYLQSSGHGLAGNQPLRLDKNEGGMGSLYPVAA